MSRTLQQCSANPPSPPLLLFSLELPLPNYHLPSFARRGVDITVIALCSANNESPGHHNTRVNLPADYGAQRKHPVPDLAPRRHTPRKVTPLRRQLLAFLENL